MRKILLLAVLACLFLPHLSLGQKFPELDISPADIALFRPDGRGTVPVAKVTYGRPQKKGRTMIGGVERYGVVWRLGANETTEIKLYRDVTFGKEKIIAGTYSLYAIPGENEWVIIFNSKLDTWGAFEYDESQDVARIKVKSGKTKTEVEALSILFDGNSSEGKMFIAWEDTLVSIPMRY